MALRLIAQSSTASSPAFPVRWCLDRMDLEHIQSHEIPADRLFVMIVTQPDGAAPESENGQRRYLVPLAEGVTYIGFSRPGPHTVYARVVWPANDELNTLGEMKTRFLGRPGPNRYEQFALNAEGIRLDHFMVSQGAFLISQAEVSVDVDPAYFAKELPDWFRRWVNWGFRYKLEDQCHMRRRLPYAILIKPFLALFLAAFYLVLNLGRWLVGALFLGLRGVNHSMLLHPFRARNHHFFPEVEWPSGRRAPSSWWTEDENFKEHGLAILHPAIYIVLGLIVYYPVGWLVGMIAGLTGASFWQVAIAVIVMIAVAAAGTWAWWATGTRKRYLAWREKRSQRLLLERQRLAEERQTALVCGPKPVPATTDFRRAASTRHALRLKYLDLKAMVCKPYPE